MPETGIDWDHYDNGPGSENWKRKMAREKQDYHDRCDAEKRSRTARLEAIDSAAKELLAIWDANEWAERADGGELAEAVLNLRIAEAENTP